MVGNLERIKSEGFGRKMSLPDEVTTLGSEFRDRKKDGNLIGKQL
jgi:hypothetical protein